MMTGIISKRFVHWIIFLGGLVLLIMMLQSVHLAAASSVDASRPDQSWIVDNDMFSSYGPRLNDTLSDHFSTEAKMPLMDTILFSDDFNSENGGNGAYNYSNFTKWDGQTDLYGNGFDSPEIYPNNGLYVLADGWLTAKTVFNLTPGIYELKFDVGGKYPGEESGSVDGMLFSFTTNSNGDISDEIYVSDDSSFTTFTHYLTVTTSDTGTLSLGNCGDCGNAFIDNIVLTRLGISDLYFPSDQALSPNECPVCGNDQKNNFIGGPINTRTGNYGYETTDLSIPTLGQPLRFERSYHSLATLTDTVVYSRPLGYGWTHNYDINLTFEDGPYGEPDTAILKAPHGSRMRFSEVSTGTYEAYPGVWAEMTRQGSSAPYRYVITAANQTVYTFEMLPGQAKISGQPGELLGHDVDISGDRAIVGTLNGTFDGMQVYILEYTDQGSWSQQQVLTGTGSSSFGESVAINGDTALIGASGEDKAYVYREDSSGWSLEQTLSTTGTTSFGSSVAIDGDVAVIGDYNNGDMQEGAAYVFTRSGTTWSVAAKLVASSRSTSDGFGVQVAIDGDTIVVGADLDDTEATNAGAVYIFEKSGSDWGTNCTGSSPKTCEQTQKVTAESDASSTDFFGEAVDVSGNTIIVGGYSGGAVYIFTHGGSNWSREARLVGNYGFGSDVAIDGDLALIGDELDSTVGTYAGAAYLYQRSGTSWSQQQKIIAYDAIPTEAFGNAVALSGTVSIIGKIFDGGFFAAGEPGAAYIIGNQYNAPRLTVIRDPQGNETTLTYQNGETLTRVTGPSGQRYLDFDHDSLGRVITITDHTGREIGYSYDTDGNLATVNDARGLEWTYSYTATASGVGSGTPHLLETIEDPDGKTVEQTYYEAIDGQAKAVRQEDGAGRLMAEISYVDNTRVVTEAGKVYTDTYSPGGLLVGQQLSGNAGNTFYQLDNSFNRNQTTDGEGNVTNYERDAFGLTHAITQTLNGQPVVTRFTYDANNNLKTVTDARNYTTIYTYDADNNLQSVTNPVEVGGTTVYTYNARGQTLAVEDENDNVTAYGYDATFGDRTVITAIPNLK